MPSDALIIELTAAEPTELAREEMPDGVFLRVGSEYQPGTSVTIIGPREGVLKFIADNWGEEEADYHAEQAAN